MEPVPAELQIHCHILTREKNSNANALFQSELEIDIKQV